MTVTIGRLQADGDDDEAEGGGQAVRRRRGRHPDHGARDEPEGSVFEPLLRPFGGRKIRPIPVPSQLPRVTPRSLVCRRTGADLSAGRHAVPTGIDSTAVGGHLHPFIRPFASRNCTSWRVVASRRQHFEFRIGSRRPSTCLDCNRNEGSPAPTDVRPATNRPTAATKCRGVGPPRSLGVQARRAPAAAERRPASGSSPGTRRPGHLGRFVGSSQHDASSKRGGDRKCSTSSGVIPSPWRTRVRVLSADRPAR